MTPTAGRSILLFLLAPLCAACGCQRQSSAGGADSSNPFKIKLDAPFPEGWPSPSPPGVVCIKEYPVGRAARVQGKGGGDAQFMTLFHHIQERKIPMSAPVVMEFPSAPDAPASMAFLYAKSDFGPNGGFGGVTVSDDAPLKVVSVGAWGAYTKGLRVRGAARLREWLQSHPEWGPVGEVRVLCYHSPFHFPWNKYSETQIRVLPAVPVPGA